MKLAGPRVTPTRAVSEPHRVSSRASIRTNPRPRATTDDAFLDKLDGGSEVLRATRSGDIQRLKEIFAAHPEAREATGHMGRRPLHIAVELERLDVVQFLIEAGVNVDGGRTDGDTPLYWSPNPEIVETLIRAGASLRARNGTGREPIHYAAQFSRPDVLRVLLDHGCDPNARDDSGHTPLHWATGAALSAFLHICDKTDPRALDCVDLLVERGADVNARGLEGNVPLHGVAVMPNMEQRLFDGTLKFPPEMPDIIISIVRLLLQHGADPLAGNNNGVAPIDMASEETRREMEAYVS
jgi:ankyrin repeat protein